MSGKRITSNSSIPINHSIEKVWNTISDFHDLSWCPNIISDCIPVGEAPGTKAGAAMRITNGAVHELLRQYNSDVHVIGYFIQDGPPEIIDRHVQIKLTPISEGATNVALNVVTPSSENMDASTACMDKCIEMFANFRIKSE